MERFVGRLSAAALIVAILAFGLLPSTEAQRTADPIETSMSSDQVATLSSLQRVSDHPLYTMSYQGAYSSQTALAPTETGMPAWACALIAADGPDGALLGRNFDWPHHPTLLLFTDAPDAYATVTMVDLAYLVSPEDGARLDELSLEARSALLDAPMWPFDGMNECGLAVGMAAVQDTTMPYEAGRRTVFSLQVIREVLDHSATVDQALELLQTFNVEMAGGPTLHYLIADRHGDAALVEFWEGEMLIIRKAVEEPLVATNYLISQTPVDSRSGVCPRYDVIRERLEGVSEGPNRIDVMHALADAQQSSPEHVGFGTQWSIVYRTDPVVMDLVMGRLYDDVMTFSLRDGGGP